MPITKAKDAKRPAKREGRTGNLQGIAQIIAAAKRDPLSHEELIAEDKRLAAYGARQAQKLGIKEHDAVRIVHESRTRRNAS